MENFTITSKAIEGTPIRMPWRWIIEPGLICFADTDGDPLAGYDGEEPIPCTGREHDLGEA